MKVQRQVLEPLAKVEVTQQGNANRPFDDQFIEEIAKQLFGRHRGNPTSKVQERMWDGIPNSEKGKYRKIVTTAIRRFHRNQKRKGS